MPYLKRKLDYAYENYAGGAAANVLGTSYRSEILLETVPPLDPRGYGRLTKAVHFAGDAAGEARLPPQEAVACRIPARQCGILLFEPVLQPGLPL